MKSMSESERIAYVKSFFERRKKIQKQIADLNLKRTQFISQVRAKKGDQEQRIDSAMINALRAQAKTLGFVWPTKK